MGKEIEDGKGELTDKEFGVNAWYFMDNLDDTLASDKIGLLKNLNL